MSKLMRTSIEFQNDDDIDDTIENNNIKSDNIVYEMHATPSSIRCSKLRNFDVTQLCSWFGLDLVGKLSLLFSIRYIGIACVLYLWFDTNLVWLVGFFFLYIVLISIYIQFAEPVYFKAVVCCILLGIDGAINGMVAYFLVNIVYGYISEPPSGNVNLYWKSFWIWCCTFSVLSACLLFVQGLAIFVIVVRGFVLLTKKIRGNSDMHIDSNEEVPLIIIYEANDVGRWNKEKKPQVIIKKMFYFQVPFPELTSLLFRKEIF